MAYACLTQRAFAEAATVPASEPIRVLIVDGQHNHDWRATTAELKRQLLATSLFTVEVATTPPARSPADAWAKFQPRFADCDVVVLNYFGEDWPAATLRALTQFVRDGGGCATFHAGGSSFADDPIYNQMIGLAWRASSGFGPGMAYDREGRPTRIETGKGLRSGHSARMPFTVTVRAADHPVMRGLPAQWRHPADELYHGLRGPAERLEILATARSPISGLDEPMAWTVQFGRGRVFATALGHDVSAMRDPGFTTLMVHGIEWAARGTVTHPGMVRPLPETVLKHIDRSVRVHGHYAAVKLPIDKGVPLHNPTAVTVGPHGKIYVANYTGQILRLEDTDGDGLEDTAELFADVTQDGKEYPHDDAVKYPGTPQTAGLRYPTALLFKGNKCYVATTQEIRIYEDRDGDGVADTSRTFASGWPFTMHYFDWTFGLQFGPDGWLYTNLCTDYLNSKAAPDPQGLRGATLRISPDGKKIERFAYGLRYSYGLAFNDEGDLFVTDNEGGGNRSEEINHIVKGGNYGHHPKLADSEPIAPMLNLPSHLSADGLAFNPQGNDFGGTAGQLFVACWGPDGRWQSGAIYRVRLTKAADGSYSGETLPFADGPGKVVALCFGLSGDLYVAQFGSEGRYHTPTGKPTGAVYRFIYDSDLPSGPIVAQATTNPLKQRVTGDPTRGMALAKQRGCLECHTTDGSGNRLGPDLKGVWAALGRSGTLEAIVDPSKALTTGYEANIVLTDDGRTFTGRMTGSSADKLDLMLYNHETIQIPHAEIEAVRLSPTSLMPTGLLKDASESQIDDLLAYIKSLNPTPSDVLRVNVGGPAIQDAEGHAWQADVPYSAGMWGFSGGRTTQYSNLPDAICQTNRFGTFDYRFDAANGQYEVTLIFAEPYFRNRGQRVFSVSAQGQPVIDKLDLVAKVGFGKPYRQTLPVRVTDGTIRLNFSATVNYAILCGIEIRPVSETTETALKQ